MNEISDTVNFPRIARSFYFEPLALEEASMLSIHMYLWPRIIGQAHDMPPMMQADPKASPSSIKYDGTLAHMRKRIAAPAMQSNGPFAAPTILDSNYYWTIDGKPDAAVIPINGMLSKGAGPFAEACMGVVNTDRVSHALTQAMDNGMKKIVLDIGSPGGRTTAIAETAALVKKATQMRGVTVYAFTDTTIASAAEWIASQADEVIMTATAGIGSIGTYLAFMNPKVAMQMQGYSLELFSAGTHKALGLPGRDITQADREYLMGTVRKLNDQFTAAVKSGRPKASEEALRDAKMYDGPDAITHGLADGIVSSWDEFVGLL